MNHTFGNVYEDEERARAYATLEFPGTYYLAFRDVPALIHRNNHGSRALDFGCGTGRSTRFLGNLGLDVVGADISQAMLDQARALDPSGEYHLLRHNIAGEFAPGSFGLILAAFTFDNMPTETKTDALSGLGILLAPAGCLLLFLHPQSMSTNGRPLARVISHRIATCAMVMGSRSSCWMFLTAALSRMSSVLMLSTAAYLKAQG
jgi:SAM-dependent methyltransferase